MLDPNRVSIKKVDKFHRYLMLASDSYREWHGENKHFVEVVDMIQWLHDGGIFPGAIA